MRYYYCLIDKDLYLRVQDQVLRRVPTQEEIPEILHACHDGLCGGHFVNNITCVKVLQVDLYSHLFIEMWCFGAKHVIHVKEQGQRRLLMGLSS